MTDIADHADIHIQGEIDAGIREARERANIDRANPGGTCWNCDAGCGSDRRWCSVECRNEWERR